MEKLSKINAQTLFDSLILIRDGLKEQGLELKDLDVIVQVSDETESIDNSGNVSVQYNKFDEYYIHKCTYLYAGKPYVRLGAYESDKVK